MGAVNELYPYPSRFFEQKEFRITTFVYRDNESLFLPQVRQMTIFEVGTRRMQTKILRDHGLTLDRSYLEDEGGRRKEERTRSRVTNFE